MTEQVDPNAPHAQTPEQEAAAAAAAEQGQEAKNALEAQAAQTDGTTEQKVLEDDQTSTKKTPEELAAAEAGNDANRAVEQAAVSDPVDPNLAVDPSATDPEAFAAEFDEEPTQPVNQNALRGVPQGPTHHPRTHRR